MMKSTCLALYVIGIAAFSSGCVATGEPSYSSEDAEAAEKLRDDYTADGLTVPDRNKEYRATRISSESDADSEKDEDSEK